MRQDDDGIVRVLVAISIVCATSKMEPSSRKQMLTWANVLHSPERPRPAKRTRLTSADAKDAVLQAALNPQQPKKKVDCLVNAANPTPEVLESYVANMEHDLVNLEVKKSDLEKNLGVLTVIGDAKNEGTTFAWVFTLHAIALFVRILVSFSKLLFFFVYLFLF